MAGTAPDALPCLLALAPMDISLLNRLYCSTMHMVITAGRLLLPSLLLSAGIYLLAIEEQALR